MIRFQEFAAISLLACGLAAASAGGESLSYNRDIRPILASRCFACHGFDEQSREAELRLDVRDEAIAARAGLSAIVPGDPDRSELIRRIEAVDPGERMPPPDSHKSLTEEEKQRLRQWVAAGAPYEPHWSLVPPQRSPLPAVRRTAWPRSELDQFLLAGMEQAGLEPAPEAAREMLLRRLSLDLTGLPPTLEELDAFLADERPDAWERAVDRLLASPHFGERMAIDWLDLARYADTNGYFGDKPRSIWPWRDWVIAAFNRDLPFDQFTLEQLAGDLLPEPSREQQVATGFLRNHMANNETGLIDEEYRVEYVADRVETTSAAWLGMSVGCARCHDHKFDPISQREYYQLFAVFNNGPETGLITQDNPPPVLQVPTPQQEERLRRAEAARDAAEASFRALSSRLQQQVTAWEQAVGATLSEAVPPAPVHAGFEREVAGEVVGTSLRYEPGVLGQAAHFDATQHIEQEHVGDWDAAWTLGMWVRVDKSLSCLVSQIEPDGGRRGIELLWQKGRLHLHLVHQWGVNALEVATVDPLPTRAWKHAVVRHDGSRQGAGIRIWIDGRPVRVQIERDRLTGSVRNAEPLRIGRRDAGLGLYGELDELRWLDRAIGDAEVERWFRSERLQGILAVAEKDRKPADREWLLETYLALHGEPAQRAAQEQLRASRQEVEAVRQSIPSTLVMQERSEPRVTHRLERGEYDQPRDVVQAEVPAALGSWPAGAPRNRLGLARWLLAQDHPLTARVAVNRFWQQLFGEGLVRTSSDFGAQGEWPTHPALLDHLAVDFRDDWEVKRLLRRLVTSAAYRQSSVAAPRARELDPENRWLARAPRFRLPAELLRDQALASCGVLVGHLGGPSVKPYQPPGLWEAVSYDGEDSYVPDAGADGWRRSLYTYWKRQSPPPDLLAFDSPTREKCTVRRARTNTPLQALVLLNDPTYMQAARQLARLLLREGGATGDEAADAVRIELAFRRITSRRPEPAERVVLIRLLAQQRERFRTRPQQANQLLADETAPRTEPAEWAAWTVVVHTLLNLDEVVVRP